MEVPGGKECPCLGPASMWCGLQPCTAVAVRVLTFLLVGEQGAEEAVVAASGSAGSPRAESGMARPEPVEGRAQKFSAAG